MATLWNEVEEFARGSRHPRRGHEDIRMIPADELVPGLREPLLQVAGNAMQLLSR